MYILTTEYCALHHVTLPMEMASYTTNGIVYMSMHIASLLLQRSKLCTYSDRPYRTPCHAFYLHFVRYNLIWLCSPLFSQLPCHLDPLPTTIVCPTDPNPWNGARIGRHDSRIYTTQTMKGIFSCFVPKSPTTKICCHPMFGAPGSHESVDLGDTVMCTNLAMVMRGKEEQLGSSDIMMGISETTITWISSDDKQFTYPYVVVCLLYWPVI